MQFLSISQDNNRFNNDILTKYLSLNKFILLQYNYIFKADIKVFFLKMVYITLPLATQLPRCLSTVGIV